ncbi:hypothetical protein J6590_046050 [Homalodisca vitripennis]|nr:hypothetical protein J6590_046050 [Homalodisca vitripennis]
MRGLRTESRPPCCRAAPLSQRTLGVMCWHNSAAIELDTGSAFVRDKLGISQSQKYSFHTIKPFVNYFSLSLTRPKLFR